jgi:type IV pilus assembly protein PilV
MQLTSVRLRKSSGFSLIECMVALVIMSFGLLGTAALQASLSQAASASSAHVAATNYANELYGRMVADYNNLGCYAYPTTGTCTSSTQDQTVADVSAWVTAINTTLPSSTVVVTANPATGKCAITITWAVHGVNQTYTLPFTVDTAL